jgi:hypothetical protein
LVIGLIESGAGERKVCFVLEIVQAKGKRYMPLVQPSVSQHPNFEQFMLGLYLSGAFADDDAVEASE